MKELDLLKKDWNKNANNFEQISEKEIYRMIHKRSSSIVRWIFIISVLEVLFWIAVNFAFNTDQESKKIHNEVLKFLFDFLTYTNYAVISVFIYFFYKNYTKISAVSSTKQLMRDILKTRKTVQFYVWYNLGMLALAMILGFSIALSYYPETISYRNNNQNMFVTIGIFILIFAAHFGLFWLFYKLLYGILLKKLQTNYEELKKIDL